MLGALQAWVPLRLSADFPLQVDQEVVARWRGFQVPVGTLEVVGRLRGQIDFQRVQHECSPRLRKHQSYKLLRSPGEWLSREQVALPLPRVQAAGFPNACRRCQQ